MSKLSKKTTLCNPDALHYAHTADILIYPDGVNIVVRNKDQYPIFGKSFGNETAAKRYLTIHFGRGWKKITEQYTTGRGTIKTPVKYSILLNIRRFKP